MQFHGGYEVSFRRDLSLGAYLQFTTAKLLQWILQNSRELWVGKVPMVWRRNHKVQPNQPEIELYLLVINVLVPEMRAFHLIVFDLIIQRHW